MNDWNQRSQYIRVRNWVIYIFLLGLFTSIMSHQLQEQAMYYTFDSEFLQGDTFRDHTLDETFLSSITTSSSEEIAEKVGIYLVSQAFGLELTEKQWRQHEEWNVYLEACKAIWNDIEYFPVAESSINEDAIVSYVDTWGDSRSYGGERLHEGTDIMATVDEAGFYPVVSVSDGVVTNIGWLEQGGYRVGITSESGGYYYYAHLHSYSSIEEGDYVQAGQLLGYMGDSGYGEEGTTGLFPVHLHFGIYIEVDGEEMSVNPYWILRFLETRKLKYSF